MHKKEGLGFKMRVKNKMGKKWLSILCTVVLLNICL
ncbi:hypothetical protein B0S93_2887 [Caldicellulosiruptor bescii]|nr:hypothetical protein B0S93_2887 [Caldicellulosiruptor bescii]